jgi:1-aminocyclopropane-1-carboxylate deaminase
MINTRAHIISLALPSVSNVVIDMLMLNELHPLISGNKYFKLLNNITQARLQHATVLVSMGGAYSNHLVALAVAGNAQGFKTKAYIRGEKTEILNNHLQHCVLHNMELVFVSRAEYSTLRDNAPAVNACEYWIPEGGGNSAGVKGCELITRFTIQRTTDETFAHYNFDVNVTAPVNELFTSSYYTHCACACGTGTTLAGIITSLAHTSVHTLGIQVLKGDNYLTNELQHKYGIAKTNMWDINDQYHCGGYAKTPNYLVTYVQAQMQQYNIMLDTIYTGKLLYAVEQLLNANYFKSNSRILLVHSGGVQ